VHVWRLARSGCQSSVQLVDKLTPIVATWTVLGMQPGLVPPKHGKWSERYEAAYTLTGSQSQTCKVASKAIMQQKICTAQP